MPDTTLLTPARPTGIASRLMWPIAAILAVAMALVIATVIWTSEGANKIALERQDSQLRGSLGSEIYSLGQSLASLAVSDEAWTAANSPAGQSEAIQWIGRRAIDFFGFESAFTYGIDSTLQAGFRNGETLGPDHPDIIRNLIDPVARDVSQRIDDFIMGKGDNESLLTPRDLATGEIVHHRGNVYMVVGAPIAPPSLTAPSRWAVAVAVKRVTPAVLSQIAVTSDIAKLAITQEGPTESQLSVPIMDSDGKARAWFVWDPYRPGDLMREKLIPISLFVLTGALLVSGLVFLHIQRVALDLARNEEKTRHLVGHDPLSGLPNRLLYTQRLDQELSRVQRNQDGLAVLFLDLDRFKEVNDTHGHQAGDELIKGVARRLSNLLRGADTLARFGGDEFAIIQTGVERVADVEALARRILSDLTHPFSISGAEVLVGVSIGIALAPQNGMEREILMRLADTALYQAKNEGRNRFSFFERQMDETIKLRKIVEDDLRNAIAKDELVLHYQPLVAADGDTIIGVEALVRWPHPKRGIIPPDQFIAVAEERGLIVPLGEWVLRRACQDAARWPGLRIAVNVSPIQFRQKDFVASVARIIEETGIDPTRLEIELTEGVVVDDADAAEAAMMDLRAMGIHLALDDFGTGYSSLIYLRRFAFDKIKIDRSFLESMEATGESAILVHSIVHLGRALGLTVTAEGVETKEQHRFLQAVGCHELQGYLFSRPITAEEVSAKLAALLQKKIAAEGPALRAINAA